MRAFNLSAMKYRIQVITSEKYGEEYFIERKRLLFWRRVIMSKNEDGKIPYTDRYSPMDFTMYFKTFEQAEKYLKTELFPPKIETVQKYGC